LAVVCFGIIAYVLALNADSVYNLDVEASAFGSAGILTCCAMGLAIKRGGPYSAGSYMLVGMESYGILAYLINYEYAHLMSHVSALATYSVIMWIEAPFKDSSEALPVN
jgi:hypothetical protein